MERNKNNLYIKILASLATVFALPSLFLFISAQYPNFDYRPYPAEHLSLVFDSQKKTGAQPGKLDFLLFDIKKRQISGQKTGVINAGSVNEGKRIDILGAYAHDIYIDIFSDEIFNQNDAAVFKNIFNFAQPFEIKSYLTKNNNLQIRYNRENQSLDFVFPGQNLQVNNTSLKLADLTIFTINNIEPGSLLAIGEIKIDLTNYKNNFNVLIDNLIRNGVILYNQAGLAEKKLEKKISVNSLFFPANYGLSHSLILNQGQNTFRYQKSNDNLLKDFNYSFEQNLWTDEVADCSAHLSGRPELKMKLSDDAREGEKSLELSAQNHFACTYASWPLEIDNNKLYKLSFDFKNIEGDVIQYYYNLKNNSGQNQDQFESFAPGNSSWQTFETIINPTLANINSFEIYLYAPADGSRSVVNLYDNIRLEEFTPKAIYSYYLQASQDRAGGFQIKSLEAKTINARKSKVVLHNVNGAFLLIYPRAYNSRWKIYPYRENLTADAASRPAFLTTFLNKPLAEEIHFQADNYANAWWIDVDALCQESVVCRQNEDNTYDIALVIEHSLNKFINLSLIIFGAIFILSGLYLIGGPRRTNIKNAGIKKKLNPEQKKNNLWLTIINVTIITGYLLLFGLEMPGRENYSRFITLAVLLLISNSICFFDIANKNNV